MLTDNEALTNHPRNSSRPESAELSTQSEPSQGNTYGDVVVRDSATVQLGNKYIDNYNVYTSHVDNTNHEEIISRLEAHTFVVSDVQKELEPLTKTTQKTLERVLLLQETAELQHDILSDIQSSIREIPSPTSADSILFTDALDRHYKLPFTYFTHWQVRVECYILYCLLIDTAPRCLKDF